MNNVPLVFREIRQDEVPEMFSLILRRMDWMTEHHIQQWNVTQYDEVYPLEYYEGHRRSGEVYVLAHSQTQEILCAAVLKEEDSRWEDSDKVSAVYVHNFASRIGCSGIGSIFLKYAENYAIQKGKTYLRLDSADDNVGLTRYYDRHGFTPVGTCVEGVYRGILRQKKLPQNQEII